MRRHGMSATSLEKELELKRRNFQSPSYEARSDEKILNMLKIMSHDVRGSLVSISATLKLLSRSYYGEMDESVKNSLKEVLTKTILLIGITEEYLGRIFSVNGDLEMGEEALDLMQDIVNPVLEELSLDLKEHTIRIDHRFNAMSNKKILIKASRIGLKAVFRNLIQNAIKHGGKGCMISLGFEDHGGSYQLNVYNSGKPVPEEYRNKLFTKFMSFGNNRNGGTSGMGLGLYLVQQIIRNYGGDIWYEAQEDGSNFIFVLPSGLEFFADSLLHIRPVEPLAAAG